MASHPICLGLLLACIAQAAQAAPRELDPKVTYSWHAASPKNVEGQGWTDTAAPFDRLPARAKKLVRPAVWALSRDSAGLNVRFTTDAPSIGVRWTLNTDQLAMPHMAATGVSGVDLYVKQGSEWHYLGTGRPTEFPDNEALLAEGLAGKPAEYRLYFPLYNGVERVELGVPEGAAFEIVDGENGKRRPVVIYGTSITHGGCASRPGMSYPSILGRRLGVPVINLGFSGNGKAEPEVARLLAELDPAVFVLDPLPNLSPEDVEERMPEFIEIVRTARPSTPILLVENSIYPNVGSIANKAERIRQSNENLRRIHAEKSAASNGLLVLVPACDFTTDQGEGTVDGVHPTDLGFMKLADAIEPFLRSALE